MYAYIQGPAERRCVLGRSIVTMVRSAESFLRKDPTQSCGANPSVRPRLLKSAMRAVLMMVTNILGEQSLQMALTKARTSFNRACARPNSAEK
jgi:hypothetical protein